MRSFPETDIYGITCEKISRAGDNIEVVRQMLAAGIKIIQYREKEKTKKEKFRQCEIIGKMCKEAGALFIVNDDVDVALLTGAGGVHLGQSDLPADAVRRLAGPEMIIGVSVSSREEAGEARRRGADYLGVGPVFPTGTKPDSGEAIGLEGLADIALSTPLPVVAIGGINSENIALVFRKGAKCAAMISALVSADDIAAEVGKIRRCLSKPDVFAIIKSLTRKTGNHADCRFNRRNATGSQLLPPCLKKWGSVALTPTAWPGKPSSPAPPPCRKLPALSAVPLLMIRADWTAKKWRR